MIIFLCNCYLRRLLSNQNGIFVYVCTQQKPMCPHKKSAQNVDGEIILSQIVTQTAWDGTRVIQNSKHDRYSFKNTYVIRSSVLFLRIIGKPQPVPISFSLISGNKRVCLCETGCKTFLFDRIRSVKSQESGLHNLIEVKAIAKKQQVV